MTFDEWIEITDGYAHEKIADILSVTLRQVRRYRAGTMPAAFRRLLEYECRGHVPGAPWRAWRVGHDGLLYAPDLARGFTPYDLKTLHWLQQAATWRDARARVAQVTLNRCLAPLPAPSLQQ
jgi:hypothetical protein